MTKKIDKLRTKVRKLLFEDSYVTHGTIDNLRTGGSSQDQDSLDLPIDPGPQMATQLSASEPPVDDPNYLPADNRELAHALSALAKDLPNETKMVQNVYEKFKKFVEDNKNSGIQIVNKDVKTSSEEIQEARKVVREFLSKNLKEAMTSKEKEDDNTLAAIAKELGVSVSGAKRLEMEALGKAKLFSVHFPEDEMPVKQLAMKYFVEGLTNLDLIDPTDAQDLMSNEESYELASFRYFLWDAFLKNVYKKMLRDASTQGLPESRLGKLTPGLYDRAKDYMERLPFDRVLKAVVTSLGAAE